MGKRSQERGLRVWSGNRTRPSSHQTILILYWTELVDTTEPRWHVGIEITDVLDHPILRGDIVADPALSDSAIIKMPGGGNPFPLDTVQWRAIRAHQSDDSSREAPAAVAARRPTGTRQLRWTREELILAMDFYVPTSGAISNGSPIPGQHTADIAQLSTLLNRLTAYPPEVQGKKYRNTNGVYMKLTNLRAVQTVAHTA